MGFDIPSFHIDDDSPEGRVVREIVDREGVTVEEAVRRGLRRSQKATSEGSGTLRKPSPRDIIGLFSSPGDRAIMDEAMAAVRQSRALEIEEMAERRERESAT